jgi:hypothetical protein
MRWLLAAAALIQSFIMAAAHENSLRASVNALIEKRFSLPWMTRLGDTGVQMGQSLPWVTFGALGLALALIWLMPGMRNNPVRDSARVVAN